VYSNLVCFILFFSIEQIVGDVSKEGVSCNVDGTLWTSVASLLRG